MGKYVKANILTYLSVLNILLTSNHKTEAEVSSQSPYFFNVNILRMHLVSKGTGNLLGCSALSGGHRCLWNLVVARGLPPSPSGHGHG